MKNIKFLSNIPFLRGVKSVFRGTVILVVLFALFIIYPSNSSAQDLWGMTYKGGTNNDGVLFEYNGTYSVKTNFDGTNGCSPYGSLILASDGNLYGMSSTGGINGYGVIFQYNISTSTYTKLIDFTGKSGAAIGANPYGSLMQASDGNLYGMTESGGANGYGVLFEYALGGSYTKLIDFTGTSGAAIGANPYGSLIQASDGNLYGMTESGGAYNNGVLFEYTPGGSYTKLIDLNGSSGATGAYPLGSLIQASDGNLYGMTWNGGTNAYGQLFEYYPLCSNTYEDKIDFYADNGVPYGGNPGGSLLQASDGNLYGMTYRGGANSDGVIFQYTLGTTCTNKINFKDTTNYGGSPYGSLMQASDGNLYGMTSAGGGTSTAYPNGCGIIFQYAPGAASLTSKINFTGTGGANSGATPYYAALIDVCMPTIIGNPSACIGSTGNLYTTQPGMSGYTWSVSSGGTITSGQGTNTATVTWNNSGPQTVSVQYTNSSLTGCGTSKTTVFNVTVGPAASASPNPVCSGSNINLSVSGNTGCTILWQSSPDNTTFKNITGGTTSPFTTGGITATTYYRAIVTGGACNGTSNTVTVTVSFPIGGTAIASPNPVCFDSNATLRLSGYAGTIQWQLSADNTTFINISGATTTPYTTTGGIFETTYYRAIVTIGACASTSTTSTVEVEDCPNAIAVNSKQPASFSCYPNPFNNITNINYTIPEEANVEINLYNVLGKKIACLTNEKEQAGNHRLQYDGSNLNQGVYYLRFTIYDLRFSTSIYTKTKIMMIAR